MIVITGASRGIGRFLINKYVDQNIDVIGTYKSTNPQKYQEKMFQVDILDLARLTKIFYENENKLRDITLINCAGINYNSFAHKADINKWIEVINVNLIGTFNVIHAILPYMREQNYGRIINMSSVVAKTGIPGTSAYAASKSGLFGMVKAIAAENAKKGITINNLNLGYFNIGMISDVPQEFQEKIKKQIPTEKFGDPENIYKLIQLLIENDYINGASIDMNGGFL